MTSYHARVQFNRRDRVEIATLGGHVTSVPGTDEELAVVDVYGDKEFVANMVSEAANSFAFQEEADELTDERQCLSEHEADGFGWECELPAGHGGDHQRGDRAWV